MPFQPAILGVLSLAVGCSSSAARAAVSRPEAPAEAAQAAADANTIDDETADGEASPVRRTTPEMWALLDRLNGWCTSYPGECNLHERPAEYPDQVASGETNGFLSDAKQRLDALGADYLFNISFLRYQARSEYDIGLMIGGNFAVDHLGPELHGKILQRAHADPTE